MRNFDPMTSFGEDVAAGYDDSLRGDEAETVDRLAELAGGGPVLELAIGTGRVALPLAATGVRVDGVEQSAAMVRRLRAKPGGEDLAVTMGDMADVPVAGRYPLIYLVFNTLGNLVTQDDQVRCLQNVARHLTDDGVFLVEMFVPNGYHRLDCDQRVGATAVRTDEVRLEVLRHDPVEQLLDKCHVTLGGGGVRLDPIVLRYVWPSELDLMARLAGLRLRERHGGWRGEPFDARSVRHVSVYGR
jgi:SAM-dependent methyltransferase